MTRTRELFTITQRNIIRRCCRNYIRELKEMYQAGEDVILQDEHGNPKLVYFFDMAETIAEQMELFDLILRDPNRLFSVIKDEEKLNDFKDKLMQFEDEDDWDHKVIWTKVLLFEKLINNQN